MPQSKPFKPFKGWAVFLGDELISCGDSRAEAIHLAEGNEEWYGWDELLERGYRVARVEVREIVKGEPPNV
jgi:hypothetical protein